MSAAKTYTYQEVADATGYVIINDKVYDVSEFVNEHPGGDEIIVEFFGKDCTQEFEDIGHSPDAMKTLKKLYKGDVDTTSEKVVFEEEKTAEGSQQQPNFTKIAALLIAVAAFLYFRSQKAWVRLYIEMIHS